MLAGTPASASAPAAIRSALKTGCSASKRVSWGPSVAGSLPQVKPLTVQHWDHAVVALQCKCPLLAAELLVCCLSLRCLPVSWLQHVAGQQCCWREVRGCA